MSVKVRLFKGREGVFEVDIRIARLPDGLPYRERVKAPGTSRSGALRWGESREAYVLRHGRPEEEKPPVVGEPTLKEFFPEFVKSHLEANRLKPSHRQNFQSLFDAHLEPAFGDMKLGEITSKGVAEFTATLADRKPRTVNNILTALKTVLNRAFEWGELKTLPPRIKLLKYQREEMEFYDFETFDRLRDAATKLDPRSLALVLLGGRAGLRAGEIVALEWGAVDFKRNRLTIGLSEWRGNVGPPKGGRTRRVGMTNELATALQAIRHLRGPRVLYQDGGATVTLEALNGWMERIQRRASMTENGKIHILRHTFCSHLAMRGATAKAIQELAGHESIATTQRYMHLSPAAKDEAVALLEKDGEIRETEGHGESANSGAAS